MPKRLLPALSAALCVHLTCSCASVAAADADRIPAAQAGQGKSKISEAHDPRLRAVAPQTIRVPVERGKPDALTDQASGTENTLD